jgi:hypothetical protein
MSEAQALSLLLAISTSVNIAIAVSLLAHRSGTAIPKAILAGAGAAATSLGLYLTAVAAYN